ncbi:hypothetical protein VSO52_17255 [Pseudomonas fulva]|uniref:hypothetical protein n=1 Tax=Pseudomonas fulva TaxID=47880 RepID=UPI002DB7CE6D|nr:hypothetical protein [Pseudomonas fulva]MEC4024528.1 hypothetical protein [Pseudomonas fulva]
MASGMQAFKDNGELLWDTNLICYGLLKSGPLNVVDVWPRYLYKSLDLNPNEESSWREDIPKQPITGITVYDSISPVVFLVGDGSRCGEMVSGNARTLLFYGTTPETKAYVFDLMRDVGDSSGLNCYSDTGVLTFTSGMPPLNIAALVGAPPLDDIIPGTENMPQPNQQWNAFKNGTTEEVFSGLGTYTPYLKGIGTVPVFNEEIAAHLTFSRSGGVVWRSGSPVGGSTEGVSNGPGSVMGMQEGCGGTSDGKVRFFFIPAPTTTRRGLTNNANIWFDIPRDRNPSALVIKTSQYPYPFR